MKLRYSVLAVAMACAVGSQGWADEAAAKKWIDSEFQPSTLSKAQQTTDDLVAKGNKVHPCTTTPSLISPRHH